MCARGVNVCIYTSMLIYTFMPFGYQRRETTHRNKEQ